MAAEASNSHEDLVMMPIIGDAKEREPGCHVLVTEIAPYNLYACVKSMMLLRKVIEEGFPLRLLNVLGHRMPLRMLAPGETVMGMPARGSYFTPALYRGSEQVVCQCSVYPHAA